MTAADEPQADGPHEIMIVRVFDAPREVVFRNWIEAEHAQAWFAPNGFVATFCEVDARPGGRWRVEYRSDGGFTFTEHGEFREIAEPERLALSLTQEANGGQGPETLVTVIFVQVGAKTKMIFRQTGFDTVKRRDGNAEGVERMFPQTRSPSGLKLG
jgi:uncharacterized protein YndB with AHSA1/START domain